MRILIATDHFYPDIMGGSGRTAYELGTLLAGQGHEVTVFTRQWQPQHAGQESVGGLRIFRYTADLSSPFRFASSLKRAVRALYAGVFASQPPDCIHIHQPGAALGLLKTVKELEIPCVYFFYAPWKREYIAGRRAHTRSTWREFVRGLLLQSMERAALRACGTVITFSRFSEEQFRTGYDLRHKTLVRSTTGVNLAHFSPGDNAQSREKLGLPANRRILFTLRNLQPNLGLENLLEAVKRLVDEDPCYLLLLAGRGPSEEDLKTRVSRYGLDDFVRFPGYIEEALLPDYYRASDLTVLPNTERDGFGLQIAEALASGSPAVGTPTGAIPEILHSLEPRLLCASTGPESLYASIHNFFDMRVSRTEWTLRCRAYAEKRFSWEPLLNDITALFPQPIADSKGAPHDPS